MQQADTPARPRVLIVTGAQGMVNAARHDLAAPPFGRYRYETEGYTDPLAALERARQQEFEAVLSDWRMAAMNGLDFLEELLKIQPECTQVVLAGQADLGDLVGSLDKTHVYRVLPKPWSGCSMKSTLAQAVEFRRVNMENRRLAGLLRDHGLEPPAASPGGVDHVLVVDDDIGCANAVARVLAYRSPPDAAPGEERENAAQAAAPATNGAHISVQVADAPLFALRMADDAAFSCVVSDYLMPDMDGAELLARFAEKQPDCARVMLSGAAHAEGAVLARDLAHIHAYVAKPWTNWEMRMVVDQALWRRRTMLQNRAMAELCTAHNLETARAPARARGAAES